MTREQKEQLTEAFDILCEAYKRMQEDGAPTRETERLDTILGKLEQLIWL